MASEELPVCQICLMDLTSPVQCTPCFHKYHRDCIFTWVREKYHQHKRMGFLAPQL